MNLNRVTICGRLGKDPESKKVSESFTVTSFSIAVSEKWTDKQTGEKKEVTEWINCKAKNRTAEVIDQYVRKGDLLYVEGKINTQTWEKDGAKQYSTFVDVDNVQMFPKPKDHEPEAENNTHHSAPPSSLPPSEMAFSNPKYEPKKEDLPF